MVLPKKHITSEVSLNVLNARGQLNETPAFTCHQMPFFAGPHGGNHMLFLLAFLASEGLGFLIRGRKLSPTFAIHKGS